MKLKQLAYAISLIGFAGTLAPLAHAAEEAGVKKVEKIEVTGSSIKRTAKEGALPIQMITSEDIKKSGVSSVTDLIQNLPSMQGFTASAASVNGGGAGATTASLHSIGAEYTLVLLDGHRLAPFDTKGTINLSSLPLDAIERVEVLTEGAGALYGSDAIAGVVNFVLKKNKTDGSAFTTFNQPKETGGASWSAGISKGFGDIDSDGYNVLLTMSHDHQQQLKATDRDVSRAGAVQSFYYGGGDGVAAGKYWMIQSTSNTEPANLAAGSVTWSPFYLANGNCGTSFASPVPDKAGIVQCKFNYAATVQDIPSSDRDSFFASGQLKLNENTKLYGQALMSAYTMRSQYAPSAQPFGITKSKFPGLWNSYVQPFLDKNPTVVPKKNGAGESVVTVNERVLSAGGRADKYKTKANHIVLGAEGAVVGWDYNASFTHSTMLWTDTADGGYVDGDMFKALINAGQYDPIVPKAGQGAVLGPAILRDKLAQSDAKMDAVNLRASRPVFDLPGGSAGLGLGVDYYRNSYKNSYSDLMMSQNGTTTQPASENYPIGGNYGQIPMDVSRSNYGAYGELTLPVLSKLEVNLSARYDKYSKTHSNYVFGLDPNAAGLLPQIASADLGNSFNDSTYKISFRYEPIDGALVRGSYGTGFKAPDMTQIAKVLSFAGSTSGSYACPFPGTSGCQGPNAQYDVVSGGSPDLKPEKTTNWTIGFRVDPTRELSVGFDLWSVKIKDKVLDSAPEAWAFANAAAHPELFINPYMDPAAGYPTIAFKQVPFNGGQSQYKGLDWDTSYRVKTGLGRLNVSWTGTYMLDQKYQLGPEDEWHTDLGKFGDDNKVTFRVISSLRASLQDGPFTHTLTANYKSGYRDITFGADSAIYVTKADGTYGDALAVKFPGLHVPSYTTFDWQTRYDMTKALQLTFGVRNLFDRNPPYSLQNAGGGNQVGYDGRYADPLGRTVYGTASFKF